MICDVCKTAAQIADSSEYQLSKVEVEALHAECPGGTHCDCQHRPTIAAPDGSRAPLRS